MLEGICTCLLASRRRSTVQSVLLFMCNMDRTVKDNFGVEYCVVPMPSNGLCGYASFAYCITGDKYAYQDVVEDCFMFFERNPNVFCQQTEFGKTGQSLSMYCARMRNAIANVHRESVTSSLYLSDGHLVAFSVMYDIAVFLFDVPLNKWIAYNDTGTNGYICLYFNGGHFDVLQSTERGAPPPIPKRVVRQGPSMRSMFWNVEYVGRRHSFCHVWKWPLNAPVNVGDDCFHSHNTQTRPYSYADVVKTCSLSVSSSCMARNEHEALPIINSPLERCPEKTYLIFSKSGQCFTKSTVLQHQEQSKSTPSKSTHSRTSMIQHTQAPVRRQRFKCTVCSR